VGWNPWGARPRGHDLGALCERFGGGGHAAVGGITLPTDAVARARTIVDEIVGSLAAGQ
jgi:nanoRNase/pAp phosphatase (c-di-AMP/oligoRNAs hydrolase)